MIVYKAQIFYNYILDFLAYRLAFSYILFISLISVAFLIVIKYKHYTTNSKTQISWKIYITLICFFFLLTFISYIYDFSIEMEVQQDIDIARYHSIIKYMIISWFMLFTMLSLYLYIMNRIDSIVVVGLILYVILTLFIFYLLLCEWYIINPLITAEIERQNYIAEQARQAAADAANQLTIANFDKDFFICLSIYILGVFTGFALLYYAL